MSEWIHVFPLDDIVEHITGPNNMEFDPPRCICGPSYDVENQIVIHTAMDRRECFEGEQK